MRGTPQYNLKMFRHNNNNLIPNIYFNKKYTKISSLLIKLISYLFL